MGLEHCIEELITIFNDCFEKSHHTRLVKGGEEPLYLPKGKDCDYHRILFARGYFSSALHEIAHWLIAGHARRQLEDYGYWYEPDGRTADMQRLFEQVEVKPQALEWIMSSACGFRFQLSVDNLTGDPGDISAFRDAVYQQVLKYCQDGLPQRALQLRQALSGFYGTQSVLDGSQFSPL